ncbi:MAG: type I-A CRISPR-associated protein Cas7/Csa2 [Candidatus Omnitrophica bacterium]|nr:type I-A CRISPR-associated protein Cas7/Csa2 [Candidatus Omnitrophota bacterium]
MKDIFISIRGRLLLNVEALNMAESVGNYVKHRKVPVLVPEENGFVTYFVPAISGESIAHGFQKTLAEEAEKRSIAVCKLCSKGVFLKSTNNKVINEAFNNPPNTDIEEFIVKNCFVEDVGGFMYAEAENVKRTSNFYVGYMIPAKEALEHVVVDPQLHSRYALGTSFVAEQGQMIYYVELSSALYTFSMDLDTKYIGRLTFQYENAGKDLFEKDERRKRLDTVLDALKVFLLEQPFGAKKTRFLPQGEWNSIVISVSDKTWTASSPFTSKYIESTLKKKDKISYNTEIFVGKVEENNIEEAIINAIEHGKQRISVQ